VKFSDISYVHTALSLRSQSTHRLTRAPPLSAHSTTSLTATQANRADMAERVHKPGGAVRGLPWRPLRSARPLAWPRLRDAGGMRWSESTRPTRRIHNATETTRNNEHAVHAQPQARPKDATPAAQNNKRCAEKLFIIIATRWSAMHAMEACWSRAVVASSTPQQVGPPSGRRPRR